MENQARPEAEIRLEKLEELKKRGINPYPSITPEHIAIEEALKLVEKSAKKISVVGRITSIRKHGKLAFIDIVDSTGKIQILASKSEMDIEMSDNIKYGFETVDLLDSGDYIWVHGDAYRTKSGEPTISIFDYQILAKSLLPIPEGWHGLEDVETRYRQRALDLKINKEAHDIIRSRSKIISTIRHFLERNGFIEVNTPVLQPIPGGATAKPFITKYNVMDADFYLRISDELYLKRLVVGGFERVYEIGPDFRNEGLSHMHNPEFTMCEFYWAYQTHEGLMKITQELVQELVKATHNGSLELVYQKQKLDFSGDFAVKKYRDIVKDDTGIDLEKENTFEKLNAAVKKAGITFEGQKIKVWSELVDELFKKVSRPKIIQPTFVTDYPITTAPLAKRYEKDPDTAQKFQLILAGGFEVVNAYSELNDPLDQEARFKEQMNMRESGWDEAQMLDENYIEALKFGMPPTAGWGMGIERMTMILTDQHSIKEVIPFPTLRPVK